MKYICVKNWEEDTGFGMVDTNTSEQFIIFPNGISHNTMFNSLKKEHEDLEIVSAGFINKDKDNRYICHGNSSSLNVESRKDIDTILINLNF